MKLYHWENKLCPKMLLGQIDHVFRHGSAKAKLLTVHWMRRCFHFWWSAPERKIARLQNFSGISRRKLSIFCLALCGCAIGDCRQEFFGRVYAKLGVPKRTLNPNRSSRRQFVIPSTETAGWWHDPATECEGDYMITEKGYKVLRG
jgi:hypothetical protein